MRGVKQPAPALRILIAIGQQEPHRPSSLAPELGHPGKFVIFVVEVAVHAERAHADCAQRRADTDELLGIGVARRHELAVRGLMRIGARGGEAEGAASQRLYREPPHLRNIVRRRRLTADRAIAHDIDAQRQMRGLRADIDGVRTLLERVHELRKRLPFPAQPGGEHRIRNLFDAFHQIHQRAAMVLFDRSKADAAIAE